jgi:hypothetical protein
MEKNVQWTLQKQAQQGIMSTIPVSTRSTVSLPPAGVDVATAAAAGGRETVDLVDTGIVDIIPC